MQIKFKKLDPKAVIPTRGTPGSAALDLYALEDTIISPGQVVKVRTGLAWDAPIFVCGIVKARSSGFGRSMIVDAVMDSDYRGEWLIQVRNNRQDFTNLIELMDMMWEGEPDFFRKNAFKNKHSEWVTKQGQNTIKIKEGERFAQVLIQETCMDYTEIVEVQELSPSTRTGGFGSTGT